MADNVIPLPKQPAADLPRWTVTLDASGAAEVRVNAPDVAVHEVAAAVTRLAAALVNRDPRQRLPTQAEVVLAKRATLIARDYPARVIHTGANVALCMACDDLFGHLLEGGRALLVPMPPGVAPTPCTYHLDPSRAPMPLEAAVTIEDPSSPAETLGEHDAVSEALERQAD